MLVLTLGCAIAAAACYQSRELRLASESITATETQTRILFEVKIIRRVYNGGAHKRTGSMARRNN